MLGAEGAAAEEAAEAEAEEADAAAAAAEVDEQLEVDGRVGGEGVAGAVEGGGGDEAADRRLMPPPSSRPPGVKGGGGRAGAREERARLRGLSGEVTSSDDEGPSAGKKLAAGAGTSSEAGGELVPDPSDWELHDTGLDGDLT